MEFSILLKELAKLNLPKDKFVIFGSGPMAIRGIRNSEDLDILVKEDLWKELSNKYPLYDTKKPSIKIRLTLFQKDLVLLSPTPFFLPL